MIFKHLFSQVLHPTRTAQVAVVRGTTKAKATGVDVRSLTPTQPMSEAEKVERYRKGRFAEMTDAQAGV